MTASTSKRIIMKGEIICISNAKLSGIVELPSSSSANLDRQASTGQDNMYYIISVLQAMKNQESTVYKPSPYLKGTAVTEHDRKKLCVWGYTMADKCKVDRNIATVAINYFDRFLSCHGYRSVEVCLAGVREFQLAFDVSFEGIKNQRNMTSAFLLLQHDFINLHLDSLS